MTIVGRILTIVLTSIGLLMSPPAWADGDSSVDSIRLVRVPGDSVQLQMTVDVNDSLVGPDDVLLVVPQLLSGADSINLPTVGVYGRHIYYYKVRAGVSLLQEPGGIRLRAGQGRLPYRYAATTPYQPWMDSARVHVRTQVYRACQPVLTLADAWVDCSEPRYVRHPGNRETLRGTVERRAYIDFQVNKTDILPDYHRNRSELQKIRAAIDSVQRDPRSNILGVTICGYASPEGSYASNERLARERTESLRRFLLTRYGLDSLRITTNHVAEDWDGLRQAVSRMSSPRRDALLAVIDSDDDPDARLLRLRQQFPDDYRYLLDSVFPYLRHTDYRIDYERFTDRGFDGWTDTLRVLPTADVPEQDSRAWFDVYQPDYALKTNVLFDALGALNFEIEVPFGRHREWSIMAEDWFPWYVWHHNSRAYEVWNVGAELRRWLGRCPERRPVLSGRFIGLYGSTGKYDLEWGSRGYQGEFTSVGLTYGYSHVLSRHWNLELSASVGALWGPHRRYHGEFSDTHLIWKHTDDTFYVGPTKLKLSLVWLLQSPFRRHHQKGGRL